MKIKAKVMKEFLTRFRMSGQQKILECILEFGQDGMHIVANSPSRSCRSQGWLKTNAFAQYEVLPKVPLNDLDNFVSLFSRFEDEIELVKKGNVLVIKDGNKSVEVELVDDEYIKVDAVKLSLDGFKEKFVVPSKKLKEIYADVSMNKDCIMTVSVGPGGVKFTNTGKYKFCHTILSDDCKGVVVSKFGQPLIDATTLLEGDIKCEMGENYPMRFSETTENSEIVCLSAPRIEEPE